MLRSFVCAALFAALLPASAAAQGRTDYFNVESPQVKPITVARIGGHDYLLICNTPDNSLEIWDTDETIVPASSRFVTRVPVGLEPVSVAFNATLGRAYTANFLGDSISMIGLAPLGGSVSATLIMTRNVGDEPMDLAFTADGSQLYVTHTTNGTYGWRDAASLAPITTSPDSSQLDPNASVPIGTPPLFVTCGLKEPRAVRVAGNVLYVLGFKGGNNPEVYDFDVYVRDLTSGTEQGIQGLGSTNFNMTFDSTGALWVVGAEAQNAAPGNVTEAAVAANVTGFVKSTLYLVQGAGTPGQTIVGRDLNSTTPGTPTPVANGEALAQPTDVVVFEAAGTRTVFVTAFGSDRVGVFTAGNPATPYAWPVTRTTIQRAPGSTNPIAGPRALAVKYANPADPADAGDRVYVLNRLDNSFSSLSAPAGAFIETIALANDPTPDYIRAGRKFLYSAELSENDFVSCASCHMDGRTDSLGWFLGAPPAPAYPPALADGLAVPATFVADKGLMVTQSLQGLLNYEIEPANRDLFTNAPYHWRGDKADFREFRDAFVNLLGPGQTNPVSTADMVAFETFVNSIHYPPNPREPDARVYSGEPGTDPDSESDTEGSEAQLGLRLFHIRPLTTCAGRSCAQCHALPEGSNNRGTVPTGAGELIETAQTRGLFQREARQDKAPGAPSTVVTAEFGLTHLGGSNSLNGFLSRFQTPVPPPFTPVGFLALRTYMREFDWGVAPLVGRSYTVDKFNSASPETISTLTGFERQAAFANVGVAAYARVNGVETGYWFDLTATPPAYRVEGSAPPVFVSRGALLASATKLRDRIVFTATPLGSERRVAALDGTPSTLVGTNSPTGLELLPLVPNTANVDIPTFTKNWNPDPSVPAALRFVWTGGASLNPPFPKAIRLMQYGLIVDGSAQYGLAKLRHEAPRRFAVAGTDIRPGAKLHLFVPNSATPPNIGGPLGASATIELVLPLHPTYPRLPDGRQVWQTATEVEPYIAYMLMLGGPLAQGMPAVLDPVQVKLASEPPAVGTFNPDKFNWHYLRVENADATSGDGGWQQLRLP